MTARDLTGDGLDLGSGSGVRAALSALMGAIGTNEAGRALSMAWLSALDGREWLRLDDNARTRGYDPPAVITWIPFTEADLSEGVGLTAVLGALHVDGRIRQRATRVLVERPGRLQAAALALRCLDHVREIRDEALPGLLTHIRPSEAEVIIGVLRAGSARVGAADLLARYTGRVLESEDAGPTLELLRDSADRTVRRWAWEVSLAGGSMPSGEVFDVATSDGDQVVRSFCLSRIAAGRSVDQLLALATGRFVDGRLVALERLSDEHLTDEVLESALTDRSARVRELARWRAGRRGVDVAEIYRRDLRNPRRVAACLAGLGASGTVDDLQWVVPWLGNDRASLRASAIHAFAALAPRPEVLDRLPPFLTDPSPRVVIAAARSLARMGAGRDFAAIAWGSDQPWSRRAGWRLQRAAGGWDRVEADLRASSDSDSRVGDRTQRSRTVAGAQRRHHLAAARSGPGRSIDRPAPGRRSPRLDPRTDRLPCRPRTARDRRRR